MCGVWLNNFVLIIICPIHIPGDPLLTHQLDIPSSNRLEILDPGVFHFVNFCSAFHLRNVVKFLMCDAV